MRGSRLFTRERSCWAGCVKRLCGFREIEPFWQNRMRKKAWKIDEERGVPFPVSGDQETAPRFRFRGKAEHDFPIQIERFQAKHRAQEEEMFRFQALPEPGKGMDGLGLDVGKLNRFSHGKR